MRTSWTLGKKLFTCIGAMGVLLLGASGLSWWSAASLKHELDTATQSTSKKLVLVLRLDGDARGLRSEQRRALLASYANDPATVKTASDRITAIKAEMSKMLSELEPLLVTEAGKQSVASIEKDLTEWVSVHGEVDQLLDARKNQEAWTLAREKGNPIIDRLDKDSEGLFKQQEQFLEQAAANVDALYGMDTAIIMGVLLLSVIILSVVVWVVRGITRTLRASTSELRSGADQVVAASSQVSSSSQSLSQGATEQAASLEETSASMEEMASMTRRNAENSHQAAGLMEEVDRRVSESNQSLSSMVAAMSSIRDSSNSVSKIIKTIDEIAFQTNILALNAAVEAARAGEAGMGFAVVADEVRSLAQRSAQAAKDTAALIEESIEKSRDGSVRVEQVATAIAGITESVTKVKGLVHEVSEASRQQTQGIDQVSQAIAQMEKVTQSTAATAEESAAASEELNAQAEATKGVVGQLEILVGRDAGHAAHVPASSRHGGKPGMLARAGKVIPLTRKSKPSAAEQQIPLEDDGTYGNF